MNLLRKEVSIVIRKIMIIMVMTLLVCPNLSEAGWLFHATKRALAEKIMKRGFQVSKMKPSARFGRGIYSSESKALALKERPASDAVVLLKDTKMLQKRSINTSQLSGEQLKKLSGDLDLRGNIHRGIIGPDLGRHIGKAAGNSGHVIAYQSAKGKGYNFFIPKELYKKQRNIVEPRKILSAGDVVKQN